MISLTKHGFQDLLKKGEITVCVVGLGRIGLPTAVVFARAGAHVIAADINKNVVNLVKSGSCQFPDEPKLEENIKQLVKEGKLRVTFNVSEAVRGADIIIVCVPTPVDESKVPDYSAIRAACRDISRTLEDGALVVIESTVGPGTVESVVVPLLEKGTGKKAGVDFGVASCPERADPGRILEDLCNVPRIIGGINDTITATTASLYEAALGTVVVRVSSPKIANAVKLTENLFRDVNIALANEFAILYEKLGIDVIEVINACATKYNFIPHYPGPGVGGPCLPQNPYYLIVEGLKVGNIPYLIRLAREVNDRMPEHVVNLVTDALNDVAKTVKGAKIAILGVAYKPNIHDFQLTPAEKIINRLREMGAIMAIYDPMFKNETVFDIKVAENLDMAIEGADCIVICTAHKNFKNLDLVYISKLVRSPAAFVDSRNILDPEVVRKIGFAYRGVGRR